MHAVDLFRKKPVFSFEVFPPKRTSPVETIYRTLDGLQDLRPDFISVTYGAGGSLPGASTCEIAAAIRDRYGIEAVAHLPCINYTKAEILETLEAFQAHGITNLLALRGDRNPDLPQKHDFRYAAELIAFLQTHGEFDIAAACYPERHVEAPDLDTDIRHLQEKVDAGASHLITQLFFDNASFYTFLHKARQAGISVPIEAGIMPVTNKKQIAHMVTLCGASIPPALAKLLSRYEAEPEALYAAGIDYAITQIHDLLANGVDGIHLYTMNNAETARRITEAVFPERLCNR